MHASPSATRHVLLIDAYNEREMYAEAIRSQGFVVTTAATATEGLIVLRQHRPDVIVQGMRLPDLDGRELIDCHAEAGARTLAIFL